MILRPLPKRLLGGFLAVLSLATNSVFLHAQETNLWAQRRAAATRQFAALPALARPLQSVLSVNPSSSASVAGADGFRDALRASPGRVREGKANARISVVHIQDIHLNAEAQGNIRATVENLAARSAIDLIALEGAFEPIDLSAFARFPARDSVRRAVGHLLAKGRITGPLAAAMEGSRPLPPIIGVDDEKFYEANAAAYRASIALAPSHRAELKRQASELAAEKATALNPDLLAFDRIVDGFHRGSLALSPYLGALARAGTGSSAINVFLRASELERSLDFQRVERERAGLIADLARGLPEGDYRALAESALAYRDGAVPHATFYRRLGDAAAKARVDWARYPAMQTYLRYVDAADRIDVDALFSEMQAAEDIAFARLCRTPGERTLVERGRSLAIAEKLLDFGLTAQEWSRYKPVRSPDMRPFEEFYRQALHRDEAIARNLLDAIKRTGAKRSVLVAGGFHSSGVRQRLEKAGIDCLSFTPRVTRLDDEMGGKALSVIAREKTPLDRIFEDRKLFLSQRLSPASIRNEGGLLVDAVQIDAGRPERMLPAVPSRAIPVQDGTRVEFAVGDGENDPVVAVGVTSEGLSGPTLEKRERRSVAGIVGTSLREEVGREFWHGRVASMLVALLTVFWIGSLGVSTVLDVVLGAAVLVASVRTLIGQVGFVERHDNSLYPIRQRLVRGAATLLFNAMAIAPIALDLLPVAGIPVLDTAIRFAVGLTLSTVTHALWSGFAPSAYRMTTEQRIGPDHPILGVAGASNAGKEAFVENRIHRNFDKDDAIFTGDRAVFITLATMNSADKIDYWFVRMMETIEKIQMNLYVEIFVVVNGSTDDTVAHVRRMMASYKRDIRITLIDEPERIGQNGAFNYALVEERRRYAELKKANPNLKLYVQLADDDAYFPRDADFDPDYPEELKVTPIESNIRLLEDDALATRIIGHPVKVISANPIAPPIRMERSVRGFLRYMFQRFTHARRDRYRIALAQVYGANATLNIEDFPERFPESITAGDCFLCATHFPLIATNPFAYFEHAEPGDWQTFVLRYVRDLIFNEQLDSFLSEDPIRGARFKEFKKARQASHDELTRMVYRRHSPLFSLTGILHWLNGWVKSRIAKKVANGWRPAVSSGPSMFRGTNVSNNREERIGAILHNNGKVAFVQPGRTIIETAEEYLWEFVVMAMDIDTNLDNLITFDEAQRSLTKSQNLDEAGRTRLEKLLTSIWATRDVPTSGPLPILEFALGLKESFDSQSNVPNYLNRFRVYLLYQLANSPTDWVLAYASETKLIKLIQETKSAVVLKNIFDVIGKSASRSSPRITRAIMDKAIALNTPVRFGGRDVLVVRPLGKTGWQIEDVETGSRLVASFTTEEEVRRMRELHRENPRNFPVISNVDMKLGLKAIPFIEGGQTFIDFLESDHPLDEWLDVTIAIGEAAARMHDRKKIHGDLRGPYAMLTRDESGVKVTFMNPGAFEWEPQLSPLADVYGLANMLYYGLSKRNAPFVGGYESVRSVPENLNLALMRALEKSNRGNFADMNEFVAALREARASLRDNMQEATRVLGRISARSPLVASSVRWDEATWDFSATIRTPIALSSSDLRELVRLSGENNWASFRLAQFVLMNHLKTKPEDAEWILRWADLEGVVLPAEVVRECLAGHMALATPIKIGNFPYVVTKQLNPRVFMAKDSDGYPVILKVTDRREMEITVDGLDHGNRTSDSKSRNVLGYHEPSGIMTLRFQPGEFEDGLKTGTPEFLLSVIESFIQAADQVVDLEKRAIIHRDLYPSNMRRSQDGRIQLIDLGLAEKIHEKSAGSDVLSLAQELYSVLTGTVRWIPRIYGLEKHGGPETPVIATVPGLVNRVIERGVKREISAEEFASELRLVRDELMRDFGTEVASAFDERGLDRGAQAMSRLLALQNDRWVIELPDTVPADIVRGIREDIAFIRKRVSDDLPRPNREEVFRALLLAQELHDGQWKWGTDNVPYLTHVLGVAKLLLTDYDMLKTVRNVNASVRGSALATALLHDTQEDALLGTYGRKLRDDGLSVGAARLEISGRILAAVSLEAATGVGELTKPEEKGDKTLEAFEEDYVRGIFFGSTIAQIVKIADWHMNFSVLETEYMKDASARASAQRYWSRKIGAILKYLPQFVVTDEAKLTFLRHLLKVGRRNNEINRTFPGAESILVMSAEDEARIESLIKQISTPAQTWGLWTRWFGIDPDIAARRVAPLAESTFAAVVFAGVFGLLHSVVPGLSPVLQVALAAVAAQLVYALPSLTGSFERGPGGKWRLAPASFAAFREHLAGPGLLFHAPLYLAWFALAPFMDTSLSVTLLTIMAGTFLFGVSVAVAAHSRHNNAPGRDINEALRGTTTNLEVDSILPLKPPLGSPLTRFNVLETLPILSDDLTVLALDRVSETTSGDLLAATEALLGRNPDARVLMALAPALQGTDTARAWAEAARRHPGQLLIEESPEAALYVAANEVTGFDMTALDRRIEALIGTGWLSGRPAHVRVLSPESMPLLNGDALPADSVLRRALFHFLDALLKEMTAASRFDALNFISTAKLIATQA